MSRRTSERPSEFEALVRAHWDAVFRLARSWTGSADEAEDLTQEAFLRALRRWDAFVDQDGDGSSRAWLLRITTNLFLDEKRRRKRSRAEPLHPDQEPAATMRHPSAALETAELSEQARSALNELSELTRLVFLLRAQEDLSFQEIAAIADTTEQSARWHMRRARVFLMERLGDSL